METQNSSKKIEAVNGIATKSTLFVSDGCDKLNALRSATEAIGVPVFDKIYNVMADTMKGGVELVHTSAETLAGMCADWGSRSGFGAKAEAAFEEAQKTAKAVIGAEYTGKPCAESDGLHENVSAETVGAFTNNLIEFIQVKNTFIYGIANVANESSTPDTEDLFATIGSGMEKFTNAIVEVVEENKTELAKFGMNLEEVSGALKAKAANVAEAGANAAKVSRSNHVC